MEALTSSPSEVDLDDTSGNEDSKTDSSDDMAPRRPQDTNNNSKRDLENIEASNNDDEDNSQNICNVHSNNFHTNDGLNFTC